MIHRLVYHSLVPSPASGPDKGRLTSTDNVSYVSAFAPIYRRKALSLEITLEEPKPVDYKDTPYALDDVFSNAEESDSQRTSTTFESGTSIGSEVTQEPQQEPPPISMQIFSAARCWTGVQAGVNVMIPDRSVLWWPYCVLFASLYSSLSAIHFLALARWICNSPWTAPRIWRRRSSLRCCGSIYGSWKLCASQFVTVSPSLLHD